MYIIYLCVHVQSFIDLGPFACRAPYFKQILVELLPGIDEQIFTLLNCYNDKDEQLFLQSFQISMVVIVVLGLEIFVTFV